jgi:hypothetical protein
MEQWHKPEEAHPQFETDESGLSKDVLVYGYVLTGESVEPCYGIGYTNRDRKWYCTTTNGSYECAKDGTPIGLDDDFWLLMWRDLGDPPCKLPKTLHKAEKDAL